MASIEFKHVSKTYPGSKAPVIKDMNLEINDQEFVIFVGPSGCGKSTTLRLIAGLEDISSGDIFIDGVRSNEIPPKERDIAMVFQSYALYPNMTVYKNIAFPLKIRKFSQKEIDDRVVTAEALCRKKKLSPEETQKCLKKVSRETRFTKDEIDSKVHAVAKILDLEPLLDRKPKALSGGQRQRVALGRAMVRSPKVFLLDEPLSNLDAKLRTEMRSQIASLHKSLKTTFVYVTHDQTEAMTIADRIVVINNGNIEQFDTPRNLYDFPSNIFVAGFIGSPEMNFLNGQFHIENGKYYILLDEKKIYLPGDIDNKQKEIIQPFDGRDVVLGIRPEAISIIAENTATASEDNVFTIHVELSEFLGAEVYLYFEFAGTHCMARIQSIHRIYTGDDIRISLVPSNIYVFDSKTTNTILYSENSVKHSLEDRSEKLE